ncbi:hypothetical protein GY45DRAFT_1147559 [Cubamyces sp. BRFM 1775]|nr:hypothetical protein GY45DRAFT_1147559 [Cubamyces sp. BRFM 1775]
MDAILAPLAQRTSELRGRLCFSWLHVPSPSRSSHVHMRPLRPHCDPQHSAVATLHMTIGVHTAKALLLLMICVYILFIFASLSNADATFSHKYHLSPNAATRQHEIGRLYFPSQQPPAALTTSAGTPDGLRPILIATIQHPCSYRLDSPNKQDAGRHRFPLASQADVKIRAHHLLDTDRPLTTASARHARRCPGQRPRRITRQCSFWTFRCIRPLRISTVLPSWIPTFPPLPSYQSQVASCSLALTCRVASRLPNSVSARASRPHYSPVSVSVFVSGAGAGASDRSEWQHGSNGTHGGLRTTRSPKPAGPVATGLESRRLLGI